MPSIEVLAERLADWLDKSCPNVKVMRVNCTRASAMKFARPEKPGGPLFYRGRRVVYKGDKTEVPA